MKLETFARELVRLRASRCSIVLAKKLVTIGENDSLRENQESGEGSPGTIQDGSQVMSHISLANSYTMAANSIGVKLPVRTLVSGWTVIKEIAVSANPGRVFGALTKPGELDRWFTHGAKVDLRVGGRYSNLDQDKGKFLEITANERLRFTWDNPGASPGSMVEVLLKGLRNETVMTLIHSGFKHKSDFTQYASGKSGWNWALTNLKAHLEGRRIVTYEEWLEKYG